MIGKPTTIFVLYTFLFLELNTCGGQFENSFTTSNRGQSKFGRQFTTLNQGQSQFGGQFQSQFGGQSEFRTQSGRQLQSQLGSNQIDQNQNRNLESTKSAVPCPEKNGRFPVASQCDAYIECVDGVGEEKLCPEGLLFNPEVRFNYPCGYPIDVNCQGRSSLQPAQPTEDCPHQFGYFKVGDQQNCGKFMNCADGIGYIFDCPEGLAYNSEIYRCDWPDQVTDCDAEAFLGFRCPNAKGTDFDTGEIKLYRSSSDCQRYFICVNGRPRLQNCGEGNAFNELTNTCDAAENVTGCATEFEKRVPTSFEQDPSTSFQQGSSTSFQQGSYTGSQQRRASSRLKFGQF